MKPDSPTIALNSHWQHKKSAAQVTVTRVTTGTVTVSYIAVDNSVSGSVPQRQFLDDFEPFLPEQKKKPPRPVLTRPPALIKKGRES